MRVFMRTVAAMNTRLSLLLPGIGDEDGEPLFRQVRTLVEQSERVMSRFAADAELAQVNRAAGKGPVILSEALCAILAECRMHWRRTGGAFDVTLGAVNDNWRRGAGPGLTGWQYVELDEAERRICFHAPSVRLDLGGIGKGLALREVGQLLRARGIQHAVLSFGESSILAIGPRPDGSDWQLGVRDLFEPSLVIQGFDLRDASLSTSGAGEAVPHLIDPRTGAAAGMNRQVSVACDCPAVSEVLSTALITAPLDRRASILAAYPPATAVEFSWRRAGAQWLREKRWTHAV